MKKFIFSSIIGIFFISVLCSCGSAPTRCDAYGDNFNQTPAEQSDLAQK